ncbi:P pilus assembly chaperone PapD [Paraburkholderia sp. BL10I2N1]|nr:P pilus assembly chaperone PapD [Paraburkholderia sp. BL10I2N1]
MKIHVSASRAQDAERPSIRTMFADRRGAPTARGQVRIPRAGWTRLAVRGSRRLARFALAWGALPLAIWSAQAAAGVTPEVSRVVFAAGATEQSLQVFNVNKYPVLVQAWVDDGDINSVPQESKAPIIVLPPVFRMGPGDQTSLRLINSGAPLPEDRESLFWLNLYEIPATPKDRLPDAQTVTVTMRTQVKVFVRPEKLPYSVSEFPRHLVFSLVQASDKLVLKVDNPTPYYATLGAVEVKLANASQQAQADMVAPFSSASFDLDTLHANPGENAKVLFSLIDDDGNPAADERNVAVGP